MQAPKKTKIMKKITCIIAFICIQFANAQNLLKVGDKAPKIEITDYIYNIPKDKNIANKYILLEFWATWCGSCLDAVPKLNLLENKFKDQNNLIFISITDEKPEKALRTIKRIPFKSAVVSDQSLKTRKSFIEQNDGSYSIPKTFLIDSKGIIKWIGTPDLMNETILKKFLNQEKINENDNSLSDLPPAPVFVTNKEEKLSDVIYKALSDNNTKYSFSLTSGVKDDYNFKYNGLESNNVYFDLNNNLKSILKNLKNVLNEQIKISEKYKDSLYSVFFKNSINKIVSTDDVIKHLLNSLKISENVNFLEKEVWNLKIIDSSKLVVVQNEKDSKNGQNNTHFLMGNLKINDVNKSLSEKFNTIITTNEKTLNGSYDFILRNDSFENMSADLKVYGLELKREIKLIKYFTYE